MNATSREAPIPADLISTHDALTLLKTMGAGTSASTLRRWSRAGKIRGYVRDGFKRAYPFYSRAAVLRLLPRAETV